MKKYLGLTVIVVSIIITIFLWLQAKVVAGFFPPILQATTQVVALSATILLSFEYILATRLKIVEDMFGGLDKVYKLHRTIGGLAFILILTHPILLIINAIPSFPLFKMYTLPSSNLAYSLGVLALYAYSVILFLTFYIKLPYKIWAVIHKFMGIPLLLAFLHVILISSDVARYLPLRNWIVFFFGVAVAAAAYKRFLYKYISQKYKYVIENVNIKGEIVEIYMKPERRALSFLPGQFVYAQFKNRRIGSEVHPFSISSGIDMGMLRLSIKINGDYTKNLINLKPGDAAVLWGPHGRFGESFLADEKDSIWVAGGIGITPFLSMAEYQSRTQNQRKVSIYYVNRSLDKAVYLDELLQKTKLNTNISLLSHITEISNRLSAKAIASMERFDIRDKKKIKVFLCGPSEMMEDFTDDFINLGIRPWNIIKEDFNLL